jgi:ABC-type sugar transport system substrate-binding protein
MRIFGSTIFFYVLTAVVTAAAAAAAIAAPADTTLGGSDDNDSSPPPPPTSLLSCSPCMDRKTLTLQAILHGSPQDPFWQQVQASAQATAADLGVSLDVVLYDDDHDDDSSTSITHDNDRMVQDIERAVQNYVSFSSDNDDDDDDRRRRRPDALLVTIPTDAVREAVRKALDAGMPVFGLHSGGGGGSSSMMMMMMYWEQERNTSTGSSSSSSSKNTIVAWVGADEYQLGQMAARAFLKHHNEDDRSPPVVKNALFVHAQGGSIASQEQFRGYRDGLLAANQQQEEEEEEGMMTSHPFSRFFHRNNKNNNFATTTTTETETETETTTTTSVQELFLPDICLEDLVQANDERLVRIFEGCPWDVVFWNSANNDVARVSEWIQKYNCTDQTSLGGMVVVEEDAAFDNNDDDDDATPTPTPMISPMISSEVQQAIRDGRLSFGISQPASVQGYLPVILATLYLTTGQTVLAPPSSSLGEAQDSTTTTTTTTTPGVFFTKPTLWDAATIPNKILPTTSFSSPPTGRRCRKDLRPCRPDSTSTAALDSSSPAVIPPTLRRRDHSRPCGRASPNSPPPPEEEEKAAVQPPRRRRRTIGFAVFDEAVVDPLYSSAITAAAKAAALDFGVRLQPLKTDTHSMSIPSDSFSTWATEFEDDDDLYDEEEEEDEEQVATTTTTMLLTTKQHHETANNTSSTTTISLWDACNGGSQEEDGDILDGLVVSLPLQAHVYPQSVGRQRPVRFNANHYYVSAIQRCLDNGIPVIAVRGNFEEPDGVDQVAIQHQVRPNLYKAGYLAGQEFARRILLLVDEEEDQDDARQEDDDYDYESLVLLPPSSDEEQVVEHKVWCLYTTVTANACVGLKDAVQATNDAATAANNDTTKVLHYMENMRLEGARMAYFRAMVQADIFEANKQYDRASTTGTTITVQLFLTDGQLLPMVQEIAKQNSGVTIGVIGATEQVFTQMDAGVVQFALDPHWYSEGYLPVALLAKGGDGGAASSTLEQEAIETQPTLLRTPPLPAKRSCQANLFPVCARPKGTEGSFSNESDDASSALGRAGSNKRFAGCLATVVAVVVAWAMMFF